MVEDDGLTDGQIRPILSENRRVAVVGMSRALQSCPLCSKVSHGSWYQVIPVNPTVDEILGLRVYRVFYNS